MKRLLAYTVALLLSAPAQAQFATTTTTAPVGDSSTRISSTAFVQQNIGSPTNLSAAFDSAFCAIRGSLVERSASGWACSTPGTSGLPLVSNGPGADPGYQALTNSGLANMAANTVKCNPNAITGAPQDCTAVALATASTSGIGNIFSLSIGGASTTSVPNQVSPFSLPVSIGGTYADSSTTTGNLFQISSYAINTGSRPTVAVFGESRGDGASSSVWGGNFVGYANASGAVGRGTEIDMGVLASGGQAFGTVLTSFNAFANTGNFIQIQAGTATPNSNGIVFNNGGNNPISNSLITTSGAISSTNGIDLSGGSFATSAFKSSGFNVDGLGNITGTALFSPIDLGGNAVGSTLTLRSTNGVGTTDAIIFQVGNAGGTEAGRILDSGVWKLGSPSFTANGTGAAVTFGATTPAAITTPATVFKWLTLQDNSGNTFYVPTWH